MLFNCDLKKKKEKKRNKKKKEQNPASHYDLK